MGTNGDNSEQQAQSQEPQEGATQEPETFDAEYVAKLRKEAAKYRTEARAGAEAISELKKLQDAQKTAEEKAAEREAAAEKRATEAEAKAVRREIALDPLGDGSVTLSKDDAALLDDLADEDAMRRLATRLAKVAIENGKPRSPRPNPAQGKGEAPAEDKDARARAVFGL